MLLSKEKQNLKAHFPIIESAFKALYMAIYQQQVLEIRMKFILS